MEDSLWILIVSTFSIAFFHALAPDHWMPFAAIARAQKWSKLKLSWVTFISGLGHVGVSIILGVIGITLGFNLAKLKSLEGNRGEIALWLLIGFGIIYMLWGIKKAKSEKGKTIDEEKAKLKTITVWTIFAIMVLGPCEPLIPLIFLGYNYGYTGVLIVSLIFSLVTIIMMITQSMLAYTGVKLIKSDVVQRYAHAFAGLIIALTGAFVMLLGI